MQLFVSDLHLTDHDDGSAASDEELLTITRTLDEAGGDEPHTLVLLGDIVDLLRSDRWDALWLADESPWRDRKGLWPPGFKRFATSAAASCAVAIARGIVARYPRFRAELARLVLAGRLRVIYVPGNHDYMVQLSQDIRKVLVDAFSLQRDAKNLFVPYYIDKASSVYAIHGHAYDPVNWHLTAEGRWAFGDAIVLRLVNRVLREAPAGLTEIGALDAIEPSTDVGVFMRWLGKMLPAPEGKTLDALWKRATKELLALDGFSDDMPSEVRTLRRALKLSTSPTLVDFLGRHDRLIAQNDDSWVRNVETLTSRGAAKQFRYVVFGHTHHAGMALLERATAQEPRYYVNLGCWRKVVSRPKRDKEGPFVARRVSTMFMVDRRQTPGYKLLTAWHAH